MDVSSVQVFGGCVCDGRVIVEMFTIDQLVQSGKQMWLIIFIPHTNAERWKIRLISL